MCVNVFTLHGDVTIGPFFVGAEPNVIDEGPQEGLSVMKREEATGLALMRSLDAEQRRRATLQGEINDIDGSSMPPGRWNPADLRGLGGAFQDNRIVPYEGIPAPEMTDGQRKQLLELISIYNEALPAGALRRFLERVERHMDDTHFGWIGGVDDDDPFYFRVHSPVLMAEFDHHNGVWLSNVYPKKYHIHTIQRLPNRGDYGTAILEEWADRSKAFATHP